MKSENGEVRRVRTEVSDPFHRLLLIFIPDISQNNNLALVTQSNNGEGGQEQRGATGKLPDAKVMGGGNPFLLPRRGVTFYFSPTGRAAARFREESRNGPVAFSSSSFESGKKKKKKNIPLSCLWRQIFLADFEKKKKKKTGKIFDFSSEAARKKT